MSFIEGFSLPKINITATQFDVISDKSLSEISTHVDAVNYFLKFIDNHSKIAKEPDNLSSPQKLGMISYEAISQGLQEELVYFTEKRSDASLNLQQKVITTQMHSLLENFTKGFDSIRKMMEVGENSEFSEEDLQNPIIQMTLYFLPIIFSNLKTITFVHSNLIHSLFLLDTQDQNEILIIEDKVNTLMNYFNTLSHAIIDLEQPEIVASLNEEAIENYLLDFYFQIENFESIFAIALKNVTTKDLSTESFTADLLSLSMKLSQLKFSIEKMIKERADTEGVSTQTLATVTEDHQNFFREIKVPRSIFQ